MLSIESQSICHILKIYCTLKNVSCKLVQIGWGNMAVAFAIDKYSRYESLVKLFAKSRQSDESLELQKA